MKRRVGGGIAALVLCLALAAIVGFAFIARSGVPATPSGGPDLTARTSGSEGSIAPDSIAPAAAPLVTDASTRVTGALGAKRVNLQTSPSVPSTQAPQAPADNDPGQKDADDPADPSVPPEEEPDYPPPPPVDNTPPPLPPEAPGAVVGVACVSGDMEDIITFDAPSAGGPVELYTLFRATSADGPFEPVKTAEADGLIAWPVAEVGTAWYRVGTSGAGGEGPLSESVTNTHVSIRTTVDEAGATLAASNGEVRLQLPAGAFHSSTEVTVEEVEGSVVGQLISLAGIYEITPSGPLGAPARLSVAYTVNVEHFQVASSMLAQAALMTQQGGDWVSSATNVSTEGGYLSGDVSHFSYWTGAVVQPHGTSTTTYCSDGTFCHNLSTYPSSATRYASRDPQICYNCHGSATLSGPAAGSTGENVQAAANGASTVSRHPIAIGDLYCTACHDPHADPAVSPKLLKATDAITGKAVQGGGGTTPGDAYCWTCHGTISNRRIDYLVTGYYSASKGDHKTGYTTTGHSAITTASGVTCSGCHEEHGSVYSDLLGARLSGSTAATVSGDRATGAYAQACLKCHDGSTTGAKDIKRHVTSGAADTSLYANGGHRIKSAGADLPVDAPLLCTDCHGVHGSKRGNKDLLSDGLGANFDTSAGAAAVRTYCFSCHTTPDLYGWDSTTGSYVVVSGTARVHNLLRNGGASGSGPNGQGYNWLRLKSVAGHARTDTQSCYECHGSDYSSASASNVHNPGGYTASIHTASPANASITIKSVAYGPLACSGCHNLELSPEHEKTTASSNAADCGACHPSPRSSLTPWNKGCAQGSCHTIGSTAPMHQNIDAKHNAPVVSCTTGGSCHNAASGLAALHVNASVVVGGQTRTSCAVCHADGIPATSDCATCHGYGAHPAHTVAGPCIGSNCHASDAITIHNPSVSKCQACHASGKTKSFSCAGCHPAPHPNQVGVVNHGSTDTCSSCHTTGNIKGVHGDKCQSCHSYVQPAYSPVSCTRAGCHLAATLHSGLPGYAGPNHVWDHGEGTHCFGCHSSSELGCTDCHPDGYERVKPTTTTDARSSYTAAALIHLFATDASGIKATYYQLDGGTLQIGTSILVSAPAQGTKNHSLEFWSTDTLLNTEDHKVIYFSVSAGTDTNPPAGTLSLNSGAYYTTGTWVRLDNTVVDGESGIQSIAIDPGTGTFGAWTDYVPAPYAQVPAGDGPKTVRAQFKDVFGNVLTLTDGIVLDTTYPSGTWTLGDGSGYTKSMTVTINSNVTDANGVTYMRFCNTYGTWSAWEPYAAAKTWTLGSAIYTGEREVYAQYSDAAGNILSMVGKRIMYDGSAPVGTMSINNMAPFTSTPTVTINSSVTDTPSGISQMRFSNDNATWSAWEAYAATKTWTLASGEGTRTVYAEYRDRAGNVLPLSDAITVGTTTDTTPPSGTVAVNGGAVWTKSISVTLTLSATDNPGGLGVYDMQFSNDNVAWSTWTPYATSATWPLAAGAVGQRTVYVRYRDGAGNVSTDVATISDTIGFDNVSPTGTVTINAGAIYTGSQTVTLGLTATDVPVGSSGVAQMRFSNDGTNWDAWQTYATSANWTLSAGAEMKTVYAQFMDAAGNGSYSTSDQIAYALQYTLTYSAGSNGSVSGASPQTVTYGSSGTTVTALPNVGYRFLGWSDGTEVNPRQDTNVCWSDINVTAYFGLVGTHTVRFFTDGYGTISGQWIQAVPNGGSTTPVTASANDASFWWNYWYNNATFAQYAPQTIALTNVTGDQSWTASFGSSGTCPFLYTWDGDSYAFEADEFAAGYIGLRTSKGYRKPNPLDYHVLATTPAVKDGALEYKLVEERHETDYIDQAKLYTVDAPADREVYVERSQAEGVGLFTTLDAVIHTTARNLQAPPSVTWLNTGQDVRDLVSASDGQYVVLNEDRNANYTYQTLELDLGEVRDAPMVKLVIDGRTMVPTSAAGRAYSRTFGPQVKFEVQDAAGTWVAVPATTEILPKPPEFDRPFVLDVTNIWKSDSRKVRFTYLYKTYIDSILLDTTADAPVTITELPLLSADLQAHGFNGRTGIGELYEYVYGEPFAPPMYRLPGYYTRFGDVTPLLTGPVDDKFAIFGGGDEITLRFAPPSTSAEGMTRRYLFLSDGYYKSLKEDISKTVEPLPFAAMSNFPYSAPEAYPTDPDHQAYISEYNTRYESD